MRTFKELTIGRTPHGFLPSLPLNGRWLEEIGFFNGILVNVSYKDSSLVLSANTSDTDQYSVLCVKSKIIRGKPRTQLILDGILLKRYGFNIGDRVGLALMPNVIELTRINRFTTDKVV